MWIKEDGLSRVLLTINLLFEDNERDFKDSIITFVCCIFISFHAAL